MAEGDTGGVRSGGAAQSDSFSKREQADENLYVRQKEMEKFVLQAIKQDPLLTIAARLQALKQKIDEHKKQLEELDKHVADQMASGKK